MVSYNASVPSSTTTNYGGASVAQVERSAGDNYATYLKFNLAGRTIAAPTGGTAIPNARAILEVTGDNTNGNTATFEVYGILNNSWSENSLDWANAPDLGASGNAALMANVGTDAFPVGHLSFNSSQSTEMMDVTPFVLKYGAGGSISFVLVRETQFAGEAQDGNLVDLYTRESSFSPQLLLFNAAVPEPTGVCAAGLLACLLAKRPRRRFDVAGAMQLRG
jgi:hypothetical protein